MEQLITTRTLRRYTVKFHFGNFDPSFRNRNVVKWEMNVTGYSVTGATRKAEIQMCNIGFIRRGGIYPRYVTVQCESWRPKPKKPDGSKLLRLIPRARIPGAA